MAVGTSQLLTIVASSLTCYTQAFFQDGCSFPIITYSVRLGGSACRHHSCGTASHDNDIKLIHLVFHPPFHKHRIHPKWFPKNEIRLLLHLSS